MKPQEISRSPIRWAGSKRKLLPVLTSLMPASYRRYIEPFCGSLSLFVALKPDQAIAGDINAELIRFYRVLRWRPNVVAELTHRYSGDSEKYYELRSTSATDLPAEERAARFLYLNRYCFNGVYRTNRVGQFNVARGAHMGAIPPVEELVGFGRLLRRVDLIEGDFSLVLSEARRNDLVYLDPPYAGRDVRDRGEYGPDAFKSKDLVRLQSEVESLASRGAKVLLSYADLPEVRRAFRGWKTEKIRVPRNVSGFASGRATVDELILRNYA